MEKAGPRDDGFILIEKEEMSSDKNKTKKKVEGKVQAYSFSTSALTWTYFPSWHLNPDLSRQLIFYATLAVYPLIQ